MADYVKTITNSLRLHGPEPTEKWNSTATGTQALVWGTDNWGYGTVGLEVVFVKGLANTFTATSVVGKNPAKYLDNSIAITTTVGKHISIGIFNSAPITTVIGNKFTKGIFNSAPITTVIGRSVLKGIFEPLAITTTIGTYAYKLISNTMPITASPARITKYRDQYAVVYTGTSNAVSWTSAGFSIATAASSTWTSAAVSALTWS